MNIILKFCVILFILTSVNLSICFSQNDTIEELIESDLEYSDQSEFLTLLSEIEENPININSVSISRLSLLPWISLDLAKKIVAYRKSNGYFNTVDELLNIDGVSVELFDILKKYLAVEIKESVDRFQITTTSRAVSRLEKNKGELSGYYFDSPLKLLNKTDINFHDRVSLGFVTEKDRNEKYYNDFSSYYFCYETRDKKKKLIIGNYRLEFGQGLVFWNPYGIGKGSNTIYAVKKRDRGLVKYTMVDENASLYGIGSQVCIDIYQLLIFYSKYKLDATLNNSGNVKSIFTSGYHRNDNELSKKDKLGESLYGFRVIARPNQFFKLGLTFYHSAYDKSIENNDVLRKRYRFSGTKNNLGSLDIDYFIKKINIFGEFAQSKNNGKGLILGSVVSFKPVSLILSYRNYTMDFQSLHGSGFGEQHGEPQNEEGFYLGCFYKIFQNVNLSFYYDIFKLPWRSYYNPMPTSGNDFLLQLDTRINKNLKLLFRVKQRLQQESINFKDEYNRDEILFADEQKLNLRFQMEYRVTSFLKLRGRIEAVDYNLVNNSKGLLLYQDVKYKFRKNLILYYRLTFFDTDDYNSRLYQYENDLPSMLTNYMLHGKGFRWYINLDYILLKSFRIGFKYSSSSYEEIDSIGTGYDEIIGDTKQSIHFQIKSQF